MRSNGANLLLLAPLALGAIVACGERKPAEPPAATGGLLVELEGQFAAASRERGARAAFLEFLDEESIVLQPGPVWGRAAWETADELPGTLDWAPDRAQVASDGGFGYASGPWTLTSPEGQPMLEGRYVTVWRKAAGVDAAWRVVFDGGFARPPTEAAPAQPLSLDAAQCAGDPAAQDSDLQQLDLGLAGEPGAESYSQRVQQYAAPELVLFHPPNAEGATGAEAVEVALAALPPTLQLLPMGAGAASSGDLGYTYGLAAPAADASANAAYVHVWCHGPAGWRLLLELRAPLPPPVS